MTMASEKQYFEPEKDLKQFGNIGEWQPDLAKKFFDYYGAATGTEGALTKREKSLIALAVAHALQCPYCIDAYTGDCLKEGADEEQMMEAVHVTAAMKAGITLVYSTQMMKHAKEKLI
jgi:alkylhydroperoxidase/carboxymuconolactone decarboxylase family protein